MSLLHLHIFLSQDNGEGRRLGTLVVWVDGGIAADEPLLAVPINLSVVLDLPQDKASTCNLTMLAYPS